MSCPLQILLEDLPYFLSTILATIAIANIVIMLKNSLMAYIIPTLMPIYFISVYRYCIIYVNKVIESSLMSPDDTADKRHYAMFSSFVDG